MSGQVGPKQLFHEFRTSILNMFDVGVEQRELAKCYKLHKSTVSKIIQRRRIQESKIRGWNKILSR